MNRKGIEKISTRLGELLKERFEVAAVYLFGSYGTEYQTEHSDIDLGFVFKPNIKVDLIKELELEAYLSIALETDKIDLVNLNKVPILLRYRAISEGSLIYEEDYLVTSNFIEETVKKYLDFAYHLNNFNKERGKALKEAYADGR